MTVRSTEMAAYESTEPAKCDTINNSNKQELADTTDEDTAESSKGTCSDHATQETHTEAAAVVVTEEAAPSNAEEEATREELFETNDAAEVATAPLEEKDGREDESEYGGDVEPPNSPLSNVIQNLEETVVADLTDGRPTEVSIPTGDPNDDVDHSVSGLGGVEEMLDAQEDAWEEIVFHIIPDEPIVATSEEDVVADDPGTVPVEKHVVTDQDAVVGDVADEPAVVVEDEVATEDPECVSDEQDAVADEPVVIADGDEVVSEKLAVVADSDEVVDNEPSAAHEEEECVPKEIAVLVNEENLAATEPGVVPVEEDVVTKEPAIVPVEEDVVTTEPAVVPDDEDVITKEPAVVPVEEDVVTKEPAIVPDDEDVVTKEPAVVPDKDVVTTEHFVVPVVEEDVVTREPAAPLEDKSLATPTNISPAVGVDAAPPAAAAAAATTKQSDKIVGPLQNGILVRIILVVLFVAFLVATSKNRGLDARMLVQRPKARGVKPWRR